MSSSADSSADSSSPSPWSSMGARVKNTASRVRNSARIRNIRTRVANRARDKPLGLAAALALLWAVASAIQKASSGSGWVIYKIESWLSASLLSKLLLIGGGFLSLIVGGAVAYNIAVAKATIQTSLFKSMQLLCDSPGGDATGEESTFASVATHSMYFVGLIAFSFFIGIISTDVGSAFDKVAEGTFMVVEKQHTVVANWNENTVAVLRQLACAQREGRKGMEGVGLPVVVLGNRDKADMDAQLKEQLPASDWRVSECVREWAPLLSLIFLLVLTE